MKRILLNKNKPKPLPNPDRWKGGASRVARYLDGMNEANRQVVAWEQETIDTKQQLTCYLDDKPELRRAYAAFMGSGGGSGADFQKWVERFGSRTPGARPKLTIVPNSTSELTREDREFDWSTMRRNRR